MSSKNKKVHDVLEDQEQRYKLLPYLFVIVLSSLILNLLLWQVDIAVILFFTIFLVIIKLIFIVFRVINYSKWKSRRLSFLLPLIFILLVSFIFDIQRIQDLWIYRFGAETQGQVVRFFKTKEVLVVYKYSVDGVTYQETREVSDSLYEKISIGSQVSVKYIQDNPDFSYLVDLEQQKSLTGFTFILGFCVMAVIFANEIQEKVNLFFKKSYRAKKPA